MSTAVLEKPIAPPVADTKYTRILRWQRGETPGPWEMQVHPTNRCNLKCKMCWERRAEKEIGMSIYDRKFEISDERFLHLVDEAAEMGVREWTIVGGGEPMVRDELVISMVERIHGHGMRAALHTNGTRFKQQHFERLIAAGLDQLRVSIDGPTREMNDTIRGGGFDKATANLRLLKEMKQAAGVKYPIVTLHPIITNVTYRNLDDLMDLAADLGAYGVGLSHLIFEKPEEEEGRIFCLSEEQHAELPKYVKRALARANALGLEHRLESLLPNEERTEREKPFLGRTCCGDGRMSDAACFEGWLTSVIHVTGQIGPCCVSYDGDSENIKDMSLRDAWMGKFMQGVRRSIVTKDVPRFCPGCPSTYINPRSEDIRYQMIEDLPRKDLAQWDKWAGLSFTDKAALLASRFGETLRRRGLQQTLKRAWEWQQTRSRQ
jgi:MoaA/NifB/PqqE/SkfB family radical SAM enzyme